MNKSYIRKVKAKNYVVFILTLVLLFIYFSSSSQSEEPFQRTKFINKKHIKDFIFSGISVNAFTDIWGTPILSPYEISYGIKSNIPNHTNLYSLVKISREYRFDFIQFDDMISVSANVPLGFSINTTNDNFQKAGLIALHLPTFVMLNFYGNSSKTRIDKYGFNLGLGYQYFYYPLRNQNKNVYSSGYVENQGMKVIRFGIVHARKDKSDNALDFRIGLDWKYHINPHYDALANYYFSLAYVFMLT